MASALSSNPGGLSQGGHESLGLLPSLNGDSLTGARIGGEPSRYLEGNVGRNRIGGAGCYPWRKVLADSL